MPVYPAQIREFTTKYDYTTVVLGEHFNSVQDELTEGIQKTLGLLPQVADQDPGSTPYEILPIVDWITRTPPDRYEDLTDILDNCEPYVHNWDYQTVRNFLQRDFPQVVQTDQVARWIVTVNRQGLGELVRNLRTRQSQGVTATREQAHRWVCQAHRWDQPSTGGGSRTSDRPPFVGPRDHQTIAKRLEFQSRGKHIPYFRAAVYGQQIPNNRWTQAALRPYSDPFQLANGNGFVVNQDGFWVVTVKTDWALGRASAIVGTGQATSLLVNGKEVAIRDYLDDDAYSAKAPINTLTWLDTFEAGSTLSVAVRTEGLGDNYIATANIYLRAFLVRCLDDPFDMSGFELPPDPNFPERDYPLRGYCAVSDSMPTLPHQPNTYSSDGGTTWGYKGPYVNEVDGTVVYYHLSSNGITPVKTNYSYDPADWQSGMANYWSGVW